MSVAVTAGLRILVTGGAAREPPARSGPAVVLAHAGYDVEVCASIKRLADRLDDHTGAILLGEEALDGDQAVLERSLESQAAWSDIPIILLAAREDGRARAAETARRALPEIVTNVIVLERPLGETSLLSAVAWALRSRSKQFEMRDRLEQLADSARKLSRKNADLAISQVALRESRDRLERESDALEILNRTGARVAGERALEQLVQAIVDAGLQLSGAQVGAFFYETLDLNGGPRLGYGLSGTGAAAIAELNLASASAAFARALPDRRVLRVNDLRQASPAALQALGGLPRWTQPVRSYLAVPVPSHTGDVAGGMVFAHEDPEAFDERTERLVLGLVAQASVGLDNARLFAAVQQVNQTLEEKVAARTSALRSEMQGRARAEAALRQSQKMEAVGQLTGGIAHDFNNMLTGIIGLLDLMKRRIETGRLDELERFMEAASTSANRAAALVQRLLAFSRRQSLDARPIDINERLTSLSELLKRSLNERIRLHMELGEGTPPALVDANQLENAILNLVINARDAMPDGGTLSVQTLAARIDEAGIDVKSGDYVVISVRDTGVGIAANVIDKVFEPFFTTKPIGQGTGLGLSMVYGFAKQSRGHVRIDSRPGEGTLVRLYLPAAQGAATHEEPGEPEEARPPGRGQTILVVEDDESVRLLMREVLEELGYAALEACDGAHALALLDSAGDIDLLISDVGLPGMNGRQLAEIARQHRPQLPVLFVTGYAEKAVNRAGFLGTNMALVAKPFSFETLAAKIGEMLPAGDVGALP